MDQYGVCNLSIVPVRADASDKSEMLSQLLFGDCFTILDETENWIRIKSTYDDYEGWIDRKQFQLLTIEEHTEYTNTVRTLGPEVCAMVKKKLAGDIVYLVAGSSIPNLKNKIFNLSDQHYEFDTNPLLENSGSFDALIPLYAKFFLHAPYLWGGRTLFGIDCSGFTQIVFKMLGIKLKRDAWQQAEQGEVVSFLQQAKTGDLAFFDNAENRITHVGIMLNDHKIIHASGRVKIDLIDDQGIYSTDLKKHTHKLRIIKRFTDL